MKKSFWVISCWLFCLNLAVAQTPPRTNAYWNPHFTNVSVPLDYGVTAGRVNASGQIVIAGNYQSASTTPVRAAYWNGSRWLIMGDRLEGSGYTSADAIAATRNGDAYIGGHFESAYNADGSMVTVNHIVRWGIADRQWHALGGGLSDEPAALALDGNNNLYVGGLFNFGYNPDGTQVLLNRIGRWNAAQDVWEPLGNGLGAGATTSVDALAIDALGGVVVGGGFMEIYDTPGTAVTVNHIARWDGANWQALGQGLTMSQTLFGGIVADIAADGAGNIYVAGAIENAINGDGTTVPGPVVMWDGSQWRSISAGLTPQLIWNIEVDNFGTVYLHYYAGGGATAIDAWDGVSWQRIAEHSGFDGPTVIAANHAYPAPHLYAGGLFEELVNPTAGSTVSVTNHARWDGQNWLPLSNPVSVSGEVFVLAPGPGKWTDYLCVGGSFTSIDGQAANNIARFDGSTWDVFGGGLDGPVYAILGTRYPWNGVFVAGELSTAENPDGSTVSVANIAFWNDNDNSWYPVGAGVNGAVYALTFGLPGDLYAGGAFTDVVNGPVVNHIATFNLWNGQWQALGGGVGGVATPVVRALAADIITVYVPYRGTVYAVVNIYAGGAFWYADNPDGRRVACRNIMGWDARRESWFPLGTGTDDEVLTVVRSPARALWVGGRFRTAVNRDGTFVPDLPYAGIWYNGEWRRPGRGVNGPVRSIALGTNYSEAFFAGEFTEAYNRDGSAVAANHIALFTGNAFYGTDHWEALGSGTDDVVHSITSVLPCPPVGVTEVLYAGGEFNRAGTKNARGMAKWKYIRSYARRGGSRVIMGSASRSRNSQTGRRSRGIVTVSQGPACNPVLGKSGAVLQDEVIFDNLGFRESVELPELPLYTPFSLSIYDVDDPAQPVAVYDSLTVTSEDPQVFMLVGVDDTTGYAANPAGISTRESMLMLELPVIADENEIPVVFFNAVTDAPAIDLVTQAGDTLARDLSYSAASPAVSLAPGNHTLNLIHHENGQNLGSHTFDVSGIQDRYPVVMLSGFLDPAANQDGPGLEVDVYEVTLVPTDVSQSEESIPETFTLFQNYPNPFNPSTTIRFSVAEQGEVVLKLYDLLGREVMTLVDEEFWPGEYNVTFDGAGLPSGIYFYRMHAKGFTQIKKLTLFK